MKKKSSGEEDFLQQLRDTRTPKPSMQERAAEVVRNSPSMVLKTPPTGSGRSLSEILGETASGTSVAVDTTGDLSPSETGVASPVVSGVQSFTQLDVDLIDPSPYQPRTIFNDEELESLADSIKSEAGLMQPVQVRPKPNGRYELVFGERRWRAHKLLGRSSIDAQIRELSDYDALVSATTENMQRKDLFPYEVAVALRRLRDAKPGTNNTEISRITGINRTLVSFYFQFFDLPNESQTLLAKHPDALGAAQVHDLAMLVNLGHGALVSDAIALVVEGKLQQTAAAKWVSNHLPREKRRPGRGTPFVRSTDGRSFGTVVRSKGKITLDLENEEIAIAVEKAIIEKMGELAAAVSDE